ncbi:MAG: class I SAM-dependent methyltransferase [Bryobacterales bacterium]|jgi:2-polyprenyl-3-methyl-5-hydroxy-6-metoxy-1,4-benzoquinol methylase|nr:class I SAM-dependent methyltransferase [Bryobacterales bacterium]
MQDHWEHIYTAKAPDQVSWFRPHLETSLSLIEQAAQGDRSLSVLDAGAGASTLVDDLLARGYRNVHVLDISAAALNIARQRMGERATAVQWIHADITEASLPAHSVDIWHDRAVFHFLTRPEQRAAYIRNVASTVRPGGHVILSTFGPEGPTRCSGLEIVRYSADALHAEFGARFQLVESAVENHHTPFGTTQQFLYCYCRLQLPAQ